jgi:homoserine kinase
LRSEIITSLPNSTNPLCNYCHPAAKEAGAAAVVLSGAGPSLLDVLRNESDRQEIGAAIIASFTRARLKARLYSPGIALSGASITSTYPTVSELKLWKN